MTDPLEAREQPTPAPSPAPGYQAPPPPAATALRDDPRRKTPILAGILSLMPGLGQVYVGYYQRGFVHVLVVAVLISILGFSEEGPLTPIVAIFLAFFWLYNVIDAVRRAALYNMALAGGGPIPLPEDFPQVGFRGSIVGGLCLIGVGGLLLSNTLLGFSLRWLADWWPVGLILLGGYLVVKAIQERGKDRPAASYLAEDTAE